jgi:dTMP kinase
VTIERGRFIAFEGGEGSGKSTQAKRLAAALGAVCTHEPGDTPVGAQIRALLLDPATGALDPRAEALLMAADRAQHVVEVIEPNLARGTHVVTDRYVGSSLAYQGFGRGLDVAAVRRLSTWATGGLDPDLVLLLDVPLAVAGERVDPRPDRFEAEDGGFHERVREGFRSLARDDPDRWAVIDGTQPIADVELDVRAVVRKRLGLDV